MLHKEELKTQMKMWPLEAQDFRGGKNRSSRLATHHFQAMEQWLSESVICLGTQWISGKTASLTNKTWWCQTYIGIQNAFNNKTKIKSDISKNGG